MGLDPMLAQDVANLRRLLLTHVSIRIVALCCSVGVHVIFEYPGVGVSLLVNAFQV